MEKEKDFEKLYHQLLNKCKEQDEILSLRSQELAFERKTTAQLRAQLLDQSLSISNDGDINFKDQWNEMIDQNKNLTNSIHARDEEIQKIRSESAIYIEKIQILDDKVKELENYNHNLGMENDTIRNKLRENEQSLNQSNSIQKELELQIKINNEIINQQKALIQKFSAPSNSKEDCDSNVVQPSRVFIERLNSLSSRCSQLLQENTELKDEIMALKQRVSQLDSQHGGNTITKTKYFAKSYQEDSFVNPSQTEFPSVILGESNIESRENEISDSFSAVINDNHLNVQEFHQFQEIITKLKEKINQKDNEILMQKVQIENCINDCNDKMQSVALNHNNQIMALQNLLSKDKSRKKVLCNLFSRVHECSLSLKIINEESKSFLLSSFSEISNMIKEIPSLLKESAFHAKEIQNIKTIKLKQSCNCIVNTTKTEIGCIKDSIVLLIQTFAEIIQVMKNQSESVLKMENEKLIALESTIKNQKVAIDNNNQAILDKEQQILELFNRIDTLQNLNDELNKKNNDNEQQISNINSQSLKYSNENNRVSQEFQQYKILSESNIKELNEQIQNMKEIKSNMDSEINRLTEAHKIVLIEKKNLEIIIDESNKKCIQESIKYKNTFDEMKKMEENLIIVTKHLKKSEENRKRERVDFISRYEGMVNKNIIEEVEAKYCDQLNSMSITIKEKDNEIKFQQQQYEQKLANDLDFIQSLENQILELKEENEKIQLKYDKLFSEAESIRTKVLSTQKDYRTTSVDNYAHEIIKSYEKLKEQINRLKLKHLKRKEEYKMTLNKLIDDEKKKSLIILEQREKINYFANQRDKRIDENNRDQELRFSKLNEQNDNLLKQNAKYYQEINDLQSKNNEILVQIDDKVKQISQLQEFIKIKEEKITKLEESYEDMKLYHEKEILQCQKSNETLTEKLRIAKENYKQKIEKIKVSHDQTDKSMKIHFQNLIDECVRKNMILTQQLNEEELKNGNLLVKISQLENKCKELEMNLNGVNHKIIENDSENEKKHNSIVDGLKNEIIGFQKDIKRRESQIRHLVSQINTLNSEKQEIEKIKVSVENQLNICVDKSSKYIENIQQLNEIIVELRNSIDEKTKNIESIEREMKTKDQKYTLILNDLKATQNRANEFFEKYNNLIFEYKNIESENISLNKDINSLKEITISKLQYDNLQNQYFDLQNIFNEYKKDHVPKNNLLIVENKLKEYSDKIAYYENVVNDFDSLSKQQFENLEMKNQVLMKSLDSIKLSSIDKSIYQKCEKENSDMKAKLAEMSSTMVLKSEIDIQIRRLQDDYNTQLNNIQTEHNRTLFNLKIENSRLCSSIAEKDRAILEKDKKIANIGKFAEMISKFKLIAVQCHSFFDFSKTFIFDLVNLFHNFHSSINVDKDALIHRIKIFKISFDQIIRSIQVSKSNEIEKNSLNSSLIINQKNSELSSMIINLFDCIIEKQTLSFRSIDTVVNKLASKKQKIKQTFEKFSQQIENTQKHCHSLEKTIDTLKHKIELREDEIENVKSEIKSIMATSQKNSKLVEEIKVIVNSISDHTHNQRITRILRPLYAVLSMEIPKFSSSQLSIYHFPIFWENDNDFDRSFKQLSSQVMGKENGSSIEHSPNLILKKALILLGEKNNRISELIHTISSQHCTIMQLSKNIK